MPPPVLVFHDARDFFARVRDPSRKGSQSTLQLECDQSLWDQPSRVHRNRQYHSAGYEFRLGLHGSFMKEYEEIAKDKKEAIMNAFCEALLKSVQKIPQDSSLFEGNRFKKTCEKVRNGSQFTIVQDTRRLLVPSTMNHANLRSREGGDFWTFL